MQLSDYFSLYASIYSSNGGFVFDLLFEQREIVFWYCELVVWCRDVLWTFFWQACVVVFLKVMDEVFRIDWNGGIISRWIQCMNQG